MKSYVVLAACLIMPLCSFAQPLVQKVRGTVFEQETLHPLIGANIQILEIGLGTSTDIDGTFSLENVPVGRQTLLVTYLGYEPVSLQNILITSGKEMVLDIAMTESLVEMQAVIVKNQQEKSVPLNEMAIASARSFSVEETGRYASSLFDPARMAMNFAGVSTTGGTSDLFNEIIVRGNSPRGIHWRLEGIEIPNPNHFGGLGNSGGGISMLSSSLLATSDFYTGAFPAEFGNALSGAFDLNLRKGNNQQKEHALMAGILGTEIATEGPLGKPGDGSYLVNFRYSTLGLLQKIGLNPVGDVLPEYGDLSFHIAFPKSKWGRFSLFGLGGKNRAYFDVEPDSALWTSTDDNEGFNERQTVGTLGLNHKYLIDQHRYLHTVVSASIDQNLNDDYHLDPKNNYRRVREFENRFDNRIFRISTAYNHKMNAKNSYKAGLIASYHSYDFYARDYPNGGEDFITYLEDTGSATQFQMYFQWKHRFNGKLTAAGGIHATYFALTQKSSIEPRFSLKMQATPNKSFYISAGMHSKPEHPVFYLTEKTEGDEESIQPNRYLDYMKALHLVSGFDWKLNENLRFKTEIYYQYLFDVAVEKDPGSKASVINTLDVWDIMGGGASTSTGAGKNIGVDLTLEKTFSKNYYILMTGSLFDSQFRTIKKEWYNTRFNSQYQMNLLAGKEFVSGKSRQRIFGFNGKVVLNGGNRTTPIDLEKSRQEQRTVRNYDLFLAESVGTYYRFDVGISYKINRKNLTHSFMLDIQNVTNHLNRLDDYFNRHTGEIDYDTHTGLFPMINYRVEF